MKMEGIQTMKSKFNLCCACVVAMLLLSNAAFAEILTSSYCDGDSSGNGIPDPGTTYSSAAAATDSSHSYGWATASGYYHIYTTVAGYYAWSQSMSAYAFVSVTLNGGTGRGAAGATAGIDCPYTVRPLADREASASDSTGAGDEDSDSISSSGPSAYLTAYEGFACTNSVEVEAQATSGTPSITAYATASASASL